MRKQIRHFTANFNIAKRNRVSSDKIHENGDFPYIETKRLILRKLTYADAPALFDYFSQNIVTEYYDLNCFESLSEAESLIRTWNAA
ncbi:MAG: GNAT family N-acetyltransferase, partial [Neisseriaceae bacterium]|nr:GNAT family N-acetyltransferase [Neisseriaceae bacterium]